MRQSCYGTLRFGMEWHGKAVLVGHGMAGSITVRLGLVGCVPAVMVRPVEESSGSARRGVAGQSRFGETRLGVVSRG